MHIHSDIIFQDDAQVTMQVVVYPTDSTGQDLFLVTVDKILGSAIVHNKGITKHTRLSFDNADDDEAFESGAVQAVLSFGA